MRVVNQVESTYSKGAKIVLLISILAVPVQLLASVLVSRISPEAAGTLGIVELFYSTVITFFLFGGETAIIKLLSDYKETVKKKVFIVFYTTLCLGFFIIFAVVLKITDFDIIRAIIGSSNNTSILMYFVGALIVICNILLAYEKEQGHFLSYSIGMKFFNLIILAASVLIFIQRPDRIDIVFYYCLIVGYAILIPVLLIKMEIGRDFFINIKPMELSFLKYTLFLHASTIVAFLYERLDQIIILNNFGVAALGGYYLMVKIANMVKLVPNVYNSTFYPYLCNVLNKENIGKICVDLINKNLLVTVPTMIFVIFNAELIVNLMFGSEYIIYVNVLKFFMLTVVIGVPGMVLNNCLFALGKSKEYFVISLISVIVQIITIFPLLSWFKMEGLVIARLGSLAVVIILCFVFLRRHQYMVVVSSKYYYYSLISTGLMALTMTIQIPTMYNLICSIFILLLFLALNRVSYKNLLLK